MVQFHAVGSDGSTLLRKNWRDFSDYSEKISGLFDGWDLAAIILGKALESERVFFYDIGCGKGFASRDIFTVLRKKANESYGDPSLADRVMYIGIDLQRSDTWEESQRVKFYSGAASEVLKDPLLPKIDVGIAYWVLPYVGDKLRLINTVSSKLSEDNGLFIGSPFYRHQMKILDADGNPIAVDIGLLFPDNFDFVQKDSAIAFQKKGVSDEVGIMLSFLGHITDEHRFVGNQTEGYFGQEISMYHLRPKR